MIVQQLGLGSKIKMPPNYLRLAYVFISAYVSKRHINGKYFVFGGDCPFDVTSPSF